jgi:hypothetical protein
MWTWMTTNVDDDNQRSTSSRGSRLTRLEPQIRMFFYFIYFTLLTTSNVDYDVDDYEGRLRGRRLTWMTTKWTTTNVDDDNQRG